jgi:hypothetical protein
MTAEQLTAATCLLQQQHQLQFAAIATKIRNNAATNLRLPSHLSRAAQLILNTFYIWKSIIKFVDTFQYAGYHS